MGSQAPAASPPPAASQLRGEIERVDILGVPVACVTLEALLELALDWSRVGIRRTLHYGNAHSLNLAAADPGFRALLQSADLVYADGISVVWAARVLHGRRLVKMTGADWIWPFCQRAAAAGARLFLMGGREGVAGRAAARLRHAYPGLQIVGTRPGYFRDEETPAILAEIERSAAQVVLVGLGSPRQEQWLAAHRGEIAAPLGWSVGALFDYLAGQERRVPGWLYRLGLEWLWRLLVDPAGKWRRYLLGNPLFVWRVARQKLGW